VEVAIAELVAELNAAAIRIADALEPVLGRLLRP
jgi:hypothetical protein